MQHEQTTLPRKAASSTLLREAAEAPRVASFINIGERTNVTGSAAFKKLILNGDYAAAVEVARQQVENGAQIIDVNMDEGLDRKSTRLNSSHSTLSRMPSSA